MDEASETCGESTCGGLASDLDLDDGLGLVVSDVTKVSTLSSNVGEDGRLDVEGDIDGDTEKHLGVRRHERDESTHEAKTGGRDHGDSGRADGGLGGNSQVDFLVELTKVLALPVVGGLHPLDEQRSIEGVVDHDL